MVLTGVASEVVLVDIDPDKAAGQAMDISHAVPLAHPVQVKSGGYQDLDGAQVVVIAAGVSQRPGETRLDLLKRNTEVFRSVIRSVTGNNRQCVLLVATNPVDVLTYVAWRLSGFPPRRVIGSGTLLDTSRLRHALGEHFRVDPRSIHAYIIGEHGDTELPVWSLANIAGMRLRDFPGHDEEEMAAIFEGVRTSAYEIIRRKGATYYAIAIALARIVETIIGDNRTVLTVSSLIRDYEGIDGICTSVPAVVGSGGIEKIIRLPLAPEEAEAFRHSSRLLREAIDSLDL
jgi:L-lactate dehydrogenase